MPARTLLSAEQPTRLFSIPTEPAEMVRHYPLGADDLALVRTKRRSTGSDSPSSYAFSGIPALAWDQPNKPRKP